GTFFNPAFQQIRVCTTNITTLRNAQDLHDLASIEVWPHRAQLLLSSQFSDPTFEVVVRAPEPFRLRHIAGRTVRSGQHMQPGQLITGITDIPTNRGVGPDPAITPAVAGVPVKPQM